MTRFFRLLSLLLLAQLLCLSLIGCPLVRATGDAVEATGDGIGHAVEGTGQAVGDAGRSLSN